MTEIIEESDWAPHPDAWSKSVRASREQQREELSAQMEEFLAKGGRVLEVAPGTTTVEGVDVSRCEFPEAMIQRRAKLTESDKKYVSALRPLIGRPRVELTEKLGISNSKLNRLLREYFPGVTMYDEHTRAQERKSRDEALLEKLELAKQAGIVGQKNTADFMGISVKSLDRLCAKYRRQMVPKAGPGRKVRDQNTLLGVLAPPA